jgi:hypothetical protein
MESGRKLGRRTPAREERGGARLNFLIFVAIMGLVAYSAYSYVPVAYSAFRYKDLMQETVNKATFRQASPAAWAEAQLRAAATEYDLPTDTKYEVQTQNGQIAARVRWTRPIALPGYIYRYEFDHTVRSSGFFNQ